MDYYANAQRNEQAAITLLKNFHYQQSISLACLAVELYLKSKLHLVNHERDLLFSHDVVNIYKALTSRYNPKKDMLPMIAMCRKYFNESRYPFSSDISAYTEEFTKEFIEHVSDIRDFIDNDCIATIDDLKNRY